MPSQSFKPLSSLRIPGAFISTLYSSDSSNWMWSLKGIFFLCSIHHCSHKIPYSWIIVWNKNYSRFQAGVSVIFMARSLVPFWLKTSKAYYFCMTLPLQNCSFRQDRRLQTPEQRFPQHTAHHTGAWTWWLGKIPVGKSPILNNENLIIPYRAMHRVCFNSSMEH